MNPLKYLKNKDGVKAGDQEPGQTEEHVDPAYSTDVRVRLTWSLDKVQGFNRSLNPAHIASLKEAIKTEARREANTTDYFKWIIILSIVMIVGALAYYIVSTGSAGAAGSAVSGATESFSGTSVNLLLLTPARWLQRVRNRFQG